MHFRHNTIVKALREHTHAVYGIANGMRHACSYTIATTPAARNCFKRDCDRHTAQKQNLLPLRKTHNSATLRWCKNVQIWEEVFFRKKYGFDNERYSGKEILKKFESVRKKKRTRTFTTIVLSKSKYDSSGRTIR